MSSSAMTAGESVAARRRPVEFAASFLDRLPAFALAMLWLRIGEVVAGSQAGTAVPGLARLALAGVLVDAVNLLRYLPILFLASLPFMLPRSLRARLLGLGGFWTLLLLMQAALAQYAITARTPLGAEVFAYTVADLRTTVSGGAGFNPWLLASLLLGVATLWRMLSSRSRWPAEASVTTWTVFAGALLVLLAMPPRSAFLPDQAEDARNLKTSKLPYFIDDSLAYLARPAARMASASSPPAAAIPAPVTGATPGMDANGEPDGSNGFRMLDPAYPFLHAEQTPDALGAHLRVVPGAPPNIVLIVVEGLGRSFSGPGAVRGSFTPELDKLAERSLYWENFLAVQGRTFGVLGSLLASAPFGDRGLAALGERMPAHDSLPSVLKSQGYWLKFYCGYDSDFDNEGLFLRRQGMDTLVDRFNFGPPYKVSNSWGFDDGDLFSRTLAAEAATPRQPFFTLVKTQTMHTPYTFPGQAAYAVRFEQRLVQLGIAEPDKQRYREHRDIYASILYSDQQLARYFEGAKRNPGYANTIFIVVGDHRLPELPMSTRIERYHVPLLVFSPLLKAPARIRSVSSHFDLTPSLLAFLSSRHGLKTPKSVAWLGSGLDMEPGFRNLHSFPLKQTKTNLVDFVSGEWFINQDQLYALGDGMTVEPNYNRQLAARVQAQFEVFKAANEQFARSLALLPPGQRGQLADYLETERRAFPARQAREAVLGVAGVRWPARPALPLEITADFDNTGAMTSEAFVPMVVLTRKDGSEISESYGPAQRLLAGQRVTLQIAVKTPDVMTGEYFITVIASHPDSGKRIGTGKHRLPIRIARDYRP